MKHFIVFEKDALCKNTRDYVVTLANSKEEAIDKAVNVYFSANISVDFESAIYEGQFSEKFYADECGSLGCIETQGRPDLLKTFNQDKEKIQKYFESYFVKNITAFFKGHSDYAQIYVDYITNDRVSEGIVFPKEMVKYMYINNPSVSWLANEIKVLE